MAKGFITDAMNAGRILSHGKITSLEEAFKLEGYKPFSIFIIPVDEEEVEPVTINCRLYQDDTYSVCPFNLRCWTEPAIKVIAAGAINLSNYSVYWGAGVDVEES